MPKLNSFRYPIFILALVILLIGSFFLGSKYALDHLVIRQVTPTQIANAMKDDHFWVSYREDLLLISGSIESITHVNSKIIVSFKTNSTYGAQCSFTNINEVLNIGQSIEVLSIANSAERMKSGVQLNDCRMQ